MNVKRSIWIISGEASGDVYGAKLAAELRRLAAERGDELWRLDKKSAVRYSHENADVKLLYERYLDKPLGERSHRLLHTDHHAWSMPNQPL